MVEFSKCAIGMSQNPGDLWSQVLVSGLKDVGLAGRGGLPSDATHLVWNIANAIELSTTKQR